jgi:YidC/Oxa1 family membrane protein insertase
MDRNTITGLLLIFALFLGYTWWSAPTQEELKEKQRIHDSIVALQNNQANEIKANKIQDTVSVSRIDTAVDEKNNIKKLNDELGLFSLAASNNKDEDFIIENDLVKYTISTKGGRISQVELKKFKTFDHQPLILFTKDSSDFYLSFFSNNRSINTGMLYFEPVFSKSSVNKKHLVVTGNDSIVVGMRLYPANDSVFDKSKYLEFLYKIKGNNYMIDFSINIIGMKDIIASNANFLDLTWRNDLRNQEKNKKNENMVSSVHFKPISDEVDYLSETKDDEAKLKIPLKWVSFSQQFFNATLVAENQFNNAEISSKTDKTKEGGRYLKSMNALIGIPYQANADNSIEMKMYFGPNKYNILKTYKLDLERLIPLGWSFFLLQWINRFAVIPVFDFLSHFNWNYGIIILVLTIILKIVLFPIAYKSYISTAKIKVLKPEIDEISKKFPKKEQAMDKQRATMALYKKAGVNPMAGCIPMLLQFPILIAMFRFFPSSIELRQQAFLWAEDLSSYDSILKLGFNIPFYGDHVSLFALLMAISNLIYTRMNMDSMGSSTNTMPGMKTMMYIMPIMFLGFLNSYSSALNYYYFLSTMITFGQMYVIRRLVNEEKIHARIQENKKKPVTKSKFQQRLEEMAKQRGYNPYSSNKKR